jgi:PAS domain S-box-containing protein
MKKDKKDSTEDLPDQVIQAGSSLRLKAEELLKKKKSIKTASTNARTALSLSVADTTKLIYELEVHQIELEIQNEELRLAIDKAESEQYYRTLIEASPDAIIIVDATGQLQYASQRAHEIFGVPADQPVNGRSIFGWIATDMHETIFERFKAILSGSIKPEPLEYKLIRNDGTMIWVEIHGSQITNAGGQINGLLLVCRDITRRKLAEDALRESEQLFQSLFNASPDAIVLIDPHHPIISWPIVDCNEA